MENKWFLEVFVPSLMERIRNQKSPLEDSIIISDKQADVCRRYMVCKTSSRGVIYRKPIWEIEVGDYLLQMTMSGKYNFLAMYKLTEL